MATEQVMQWINRDVRLSKVRSELTAISIDSQFS